MPSDATAALLAFAEKHRKKPGVACKTCILPPHLRKAVEENRALPRPTPYHLISLYLEQQGHEIADTTLIHHFTAGHARRAK